jgi:hypothetical protein
MLVMPVTMITFATATGTSEATVALLMVPNAAALQLFPPKKQQCMIGILPWFYM